MADTAKDDERFEENHPRPTLESAAYGWLEQQKQGARPLVKSGIPDLDYALGGGMELGEMCVVGARPSHGKSSFGLQMLHHVSQTRACAFFSQEMSVRFVGERTIRYISEMEDVDWMLRPDKLKSELRVHFADREPVYVYEDMPQLSDLVECMKQLAAENVLFHVVDYLQLIHTTGGTRYEEYSRVSETLKMTAKRLGITLVALTQLSRDIEKRKRYEPNEADLKESGQIEQDADMILFLVWPHKLNRKLPPNQYQIFVTKCRNRGVKLPAFQCEFIPERQRFYKSLE